MGSLLEAHGLTKLFGVVIGLNDVHLDLEPGVIGLLGPNGAGKSTLLKLITGQMRPTEGRLTVLGEVPWCNMRLFRRIGFCPEQDSFYDDMSALEFVTSLARLSGLGAQARARAEWALERVGAAEFMGRAIRGYSKGMRQRTKLAQAIVHEPELLLLDEPLTGTDPVCRREIIDLVGELGAQGTSIIVASHVLHEVQTMTDRFVLIFASRVLAAGNVREIRGLMNEFPHRITLRCDDVRRLATVLVREPSVEGVEMDVERGELIVMTHDPGRFQAVVAEASLEAGIHLHELSSADDNLESVFKYLVSVP